MVGCLIEGVMGGCMVVEMRVAIEELLLPEGLREGAVVLAALWYIPLR